MSGPIRTPAEMAEAAAKIASGMTGVPRDKRPAAIRSLAERIEPEWRPIETAPKDGTEVLVVFEDGARRVCRWMAPEGGYVAHWCINGKVTFGSDPTDWMPLPTPPKPKEPENV